MAGMYDHTSPPMNQGIYDMGPSHSQLGLVPRAGTPGQASPRPSVSIQGQEQERFLTRDQAPYQPGSPYSQPRYLDPQGYEMSPPLSDSPRSHFDTQSHLAAAPGATQYSDEKLPSSRKQAVAPFYTKRWFWILLALLVAAGIGGGIAAQRLLKKSPQSESTVETQADDKSNNNGAGTTPNTTVAAVVPLPRYNWRDTTTTAYGINLGNWLVLERWLDEDWFTSHCADCEDEWEFSQRLGTNAIPTLQQHYEDYIQESDIDEMKSLGFNMLRVTVGYWALQRFANEPFVDAGQLGQLRKLMEWCHKRQIYISISMHGLPGSQSGDQSTGRRKDWDVGGVAWFSATNQARSDQTITALANWIAQQGGYASVIASVLPVNEPKQTAADGSLIDGRQPTLQQFYLRSYRTLSNIGMVMSIHPGYWNGQDPSEWDAFIKQNNLDPNLVIWETHPYPGYFPLRSDPDQIMNTVCSLGQIHNQISVPVFFGEFSTLSGVTDSGWLRSYWNSQLAAYSASAGSTFWTWRANNATNPVRALASNQMSRYDFQFLRNQGIASTPAPGQNIKEFVNALPHNQCSNQRRRAAHFQQREVRKARLGGEH